MGLAAGAACADVGVEAATMEQGPKVTASWPSSAVGLKIESVLRLSACPGALAQRVVSKTVHIGMYASVRVHTILKDFIMVHTSMFAYVRVHSILQ